MWYNFEAEEAVFGSINLNEMWVKMRKKIGKGTKDRCLECQFGCVQQNKLSALIACCLLCVWFSCVLIKLTQHSHFPYFHAVKTARFVRLIASMPNCVWSAWSYVKQFSRKKYEKQLHLSIERFCWGTFEKRRIQLHQMKPPVVRLQKFWKKKKKSLNHMRREICHWRKVLKELSWKYSNLSFSFSVRKWEYDEEKKFEIGRVSDSIAECEDLVTKRLKLQQVNLFAAVTIQYLV